MRPEYGDTNMEALNDRLQALEAERKRREAEEHFVTRGEFNEFRQNDIEPLKREVKQLKYAVWAFAALSGGSLLGLSPTQVIEAVKAVASAMGG